VHRIQQVIDIADRVGRKVRSVGRSMVDNVESRTIWVFADSGRDGGAAQDIRSLSRGKLIIIASGSQAEPMSSMSRIAVGQSPVRDDR